MKMQSPCQYMCLCFSLLLVVLGLRAAVGGDASTPWAPVSWSDDVPTDSISRSAELKTSVMPRLADDADRREIRDLLAFLRQRSTTP